MLVLLLGLMVGGLPLARAQMHFGLRGGAGMSYYTLRQIDGQTYRGDAILGASLGVFGIVDIPMAVGHLELDAGAMLSRKGGKSEWTYRADASSLYVRTVLKEEFTPFYLSFPLTGLYAFDFGPASLYMGLGPQFSVGLFGRYDRRADYEGVKSSPTDYDQEDIKFGAEQHPRRFFIDLKTRLGVELFSRLRFGAYFDLGLTNMVDGYHRVSTFVYRDRFMRNFALGLDLGYKFF